MNDVSADLASADDTPGGLLPVFSKNQWLLPISVFNHILKTCPQVYHTCTLDRYCMYAPVVSEPGRSMQAYNSTQQLSNGADMLPQDKHKWPRGGCTQPAMSHDVIFQITFGTFHAPTHAATCAPHMCNTLRAIHLITPQEHGSQPLARSHRVTQLPSTSPTISQCWHAHANSSSKLHNALHNTSTTRAKQACCKGPFKKHA
jgi:hypothetical protein